MAMWQYLVEIPVALLFRVVRYIFCLVRNIWWQLAGVTEHLDDIRMSGLIYKSAHVQTIVCRESLKRLPRPPGECGFITLHHSFKDPDYILQDCVSLYSISHSSAVFVETQKKEPAGLETAFSITKDEQFHNAQKLIVMPLHSFHYIASQIKKPSNLAILATTKIPETEIPRHLFGGIVQSMFRLPGRGDLEAIFSQKGFLPPDQYFKVLQHTINVLCKSLHAGYVHVINLHDQYITQALDVCHIMPDVKFLLLHQDEGFKMAQIFLKNIASSVSIVGQ